MRRLVTALLIATLALVPAACRQQNEGVISVTVIGEPPKISDPAKGSLSTSEAVLLENIGQGLVRFDANGNIVSGLAERWNVSDDGLSYIFRIAATKVRICASVSGGTGARSPQSKSQRS